MLKLSRSPITIMLTLILLLLTAAPIYADEKMIEDPNLEKAIRIELKKMDATLSQQDLVKVRSLYPKDSNAKIGSLSGLEYLNNLTSLFLPNLGITDIGHLSGLQKLTFLGIDNNEIVDIEPLAGITGLQRLVISDNHIQRIEALGNLKNLTDLLISNNDISDISPLKGLPLTWLDISGNQVSDISVLESLTALKTVLIDKNPLNAEASDVIERLKSKGVSVGLPSKQTPAVHDDTDLSDRIKVLLDAELVTFEADPFITEGSTMVPFRPIFEKLGLHVDWEPATRTVTGSKTGFSVRLQIDSTTAVVNEHTLGLAVVPKLVNGSTFIPLRFIAESMDAKVDWENDSRLVVIRSKGEFVSDDQSVRLTAYGKWTKLMNTADPATLFIYSFNKRHFMVNTLEKTNLQRVYELQLKKILAIDGTTLVEETEGVLHGYKTNQFTCLMDEPNEIDTVLYTFILFETNKHIYQVNYGTIENYADRSKEELDAISQSIEFTP